MISSSLISCLGGLLFIREKIYNFSSSILNIKCVFFLIKCFINDSDYSKLILLRLQVLNLKRDTKDISNLFEFRSGPPDMFYKKVFWKYAENLQENVHAKVQFRQSCMQPYWNCTSAFVFSFKFAAYFQNTFSQEHLDGCFWELRD